jgi:Ca-activated chloride channel family protein
MSEFLEGFRHAWVLAFLLVPAAVLVWIWRRRGRALVLPLDHARSRDGRYLALVLKVCESLPAVLLAIAIALLASPQRWDEPHTRRELTNIEFCVDVSGSMGAKFGEGTRYEAAMGAINGFIDYRAGDAFGLTFFGNSVLHWVPLTTDVSAFRCAPPFMRPGFLPAWFNGTEIGRALLACKEVLCEREEGDRMIVLVTDGFSADLGGGRDEEIAHTLAASGIVVYAVHVAETEVPGPIANITAITGGQVFASDDPEALKAVFQRIDQMQVTRLEKIQSETLDHLGPWCLAGLGCLGALLLAALGVRTTPW